MVCMTVASAILSLAGQGRARGETAPTTGGKAAPATGGKAAR